MPAEDKVVTMTQLVSEVHEKVSTATEKTFDRGQILRRAREAWPNVIDFKPTQVELLARAMTRDEEVNRAWRVLRQKTA